MKKATSKKQLAITGATLPPIPEGFGLPFYYATLFNVEVAYLVDYDKVLPYLKDSGLIAANFNGKAMVSFNFQNYTGQFPDGANTTQEIELNIVSYPETEAHKVPQVTAEEYFSGQEQTKLMGHKRVWVPCDNDVAIKAGIELFGEPKFKTTFTTQLVSLNVPDVHTWTFTCNDPKQAKVSIFTCTADVANMVAQPSAFAPITEYGYFEGKLIGCRWNILQPTNLYLLKTASDKKRVTLTYGKSTHKMRKDMEALIGSTPAFAVRTSMSAPAAIQTRAYYA